ncbi:serine/threonine-protein kinase [Gordonia sp. LSe1-13]|uniref:non-specific serine/threonine protein kinase n=1 Tax=Gordonia sesuvii TaxID=3116777 RepID=A0ABU7MAT8_9ACTN|nr:serine/threonine-protein kinase [Gordonia sp. LSe1-13]
MADVGSNVGPYRLDELLGRGAMGEVFRAFDTARNRAVALKLLKPDLSDDPTYQERFRRESRAAAALDEPHVIPIHDWGEIDGQLYIDMRMVDGESLRAVLRREAALEPQRAVNIIEQVSSALSAAHRKGLVHRDLKPENILVTDEDFAYLVDFGIAHENADTRLTGSGATIGSVSYMAPELFDGQDISPAADIYSLTCVLFECLTGRMPHAAKTVSAAIKAAVLDPVPSPSKLNTSVPPAFDSVIERGLHRDPGSRYHSVRLLSADARRALDGSADPPASVADQPTMSFAATEREKSAPPQTTAVPATAYSALEPQHSPVSQQMAHSNHSDSAGPDREQRSLLPLVIGTIVFLVIGVLGGLAYFLYALQSDTDAATETTPTVTQTVTPEQAETPTPAPAPPADSSSCAPGVSVGTAVTSCPFAVEVRNEYLRTGPQGAPRVVVAYSPVTGTAYQMSCLPEGGLVTCRGGNNAVVYVY